MLAVTLLVLVIANSAVTGWLVARVRVMQRVTANLAEITSSLDHDVDVINKAMPDPWDGARG